MHLLLQFYSDCFETLQVLGHGQKMCKLFGHNPQIIFVTFFNKIDYSHFAVKMNRY